jgi:PKD repeat protein
VKPLNREAWFVNWLESFNFKVLILSIMRKKILFVLSSLALSLGMGAAHSQNVPFRKYCATDSMTSEAMRQYPDYARERRKFEAFVRNLDQKTIARLNSGPSYTIPIVVHVIHTYGADNISDAQIHDAVRIINEDFSKTNPDTSAVVAAYQPINANVGFQFKLAKKDPNGNCTEGITRTYSTLTNNADNNVKSLIIWDPTKYLNIWVVNTISFGAGGYSYLPCGVPQSIEGVVILNTQFGSIGRSNGGNFSARSLTHEIGHYMGLPHVWGGSNTPGDPANCGMDDGIADTPNTIGSSGFTCNTNVYSCDPNAVRPDNVQNYMDYSSCARMFTLGQKAVMVGSLSMACRSNLSTQSNLLATGTNVGYTASCAPVPDFKTTANRVCEGTTINFTDQSYNAPINSSVTYQWAFPGGIPATSTAQNPTVTYSTPGVYNVTLTTTNTNGFNSVTKTNAIKVNALVSSLSAPYQNSIESTTFPVDTINALQSWEIIKPGSIGWERTVLAAATGTASARVRLSNLPAGSVTTLISPSIDFSNLTGAGLKFKVANAMKTSTGTDRLAVYFSKDCGNTWIMRYSKTGAQLATNGGTLVTAFNPSPGQWRQETIAATSGFTGPNTLIKFEVTSGSGTSLYLDDIEIIGNRITGMADNVEATEMNVYPNPSNGDATVSFALPAKAEYSLEVISITGQQVGKTLVKQNQAGKQEIKLTDITGSSKLQAGVYLVKLQTNGFTTLKKAIVF